MNKLYVLLFVLSAAALVDCDETKYIDLLPESEKQEFLNRIARRILAEIESRDSPEQPHAEITDDQLDAHNAYVQGLIKEETEVHKNEKQDASVNEMEGDENSKVNLRNDAMNDQESAKDENDNTENQYNIDLTRHDRTYKSDSQEIQNTDKIDATSLNDVPVKVLYDDENNGAKAFSNNSDIYSVSKEVIPRNNNEQKHLFGFGSDQGNSILKTYGSSSENKEHISNDSDKYNLNNGDEMSTEKYIPSHITTETVQQTSGNVKAQVIAETIQTEDIDNGRVIKDQDGLHDQKSSNNTTSLYNEKEEEGLVSKSGPTESDLSDEEVMTDKNKSIQNRFEIISSTKTENMNTHNTSPVLPESVDNVIISKTLPAVLSNATNFSDSTLADSLEVVGKNTRRQSTTIPAERSNQKDTTANFEKASSILYFDTVEKRKSNGNRKRKFNEKYTHNIQISEEYARNVEPEPYETSKPNARNKKAKQYLVYEIPKDRPSFKKESSSPIVESSENNQPQYIPIHNFDPSNVYYNPYNRFGPNNDDDVKAIKRTSLNNQEDQLDRDLYLHGGFNIDLKPTSRIRGDLNTKYGKPNTYALEKYDQSANKMNELVESNIHNMLHKPSFDMDYIYNPYRQNEDANHARRQKDIDTVDSDIDYFNDWNKNDNNWNINDLRRSKKLKKITRQGHLKPNGKILPNSNERDHPLYTMPKDNIDYMRAVKKVLYRQKQFGCLSLPPHKPDMTPRRTGLCDDVDSNLRAKKKIKNNSIKKSHTKGIATDYVWARGLNKRKDFDFDDDFVDYKDTKATGERQTDLLQDSQTDGDDFEVFLDSLIDVLHDMIRRDHRGLMSYDWLSSTVDIEAALKKLIDLTGKAQNGDYIHPLDLKLLNFVIYLYDSATKTVTKRNNLRDDNLKASRTNEVLENLVRIIRMSLPKNKHRKPGEKIKNPLNLWRAWYKYYIRVLNDENNKSAKIIKNFKNVLKVLQENLYDLHNTINHLSLITTASNQNWYNDLKRIYLKHASRRQLLQVILHLSASKLFENVENAAKKSKGDYSNYVMNNEEEVRRLKEEFVLLLRVLDKLEVKRGEKRFHS